jgi:8-oxo-dGTP pyrophosphatase MutT (NUDIX family)
MRLSATTVRVRALILTEDGVVVARERYSGRERLTLPGGRVGEREGVVDALRREVREETGIDVDVDRLLYVAEVLYPPERQDLNLIFLATARQGLTADAEVVALDGPQAGDVLPPVLARVRADLERGFADGAVWLGDVRTAAPQVQA